MRSSKPSGPSIPKRWGGVASVWRAVYQLPVRGLSKQRHCHQVDDLSSTLAIPHNGKRELLLSFGLHTDTTAHMSKHVHTHTDTHTSIVQSIIHRLPMRRHHPCMKLLGYFLKAGVSKGTPESRSRGQAGKLYPWRVVLLHIKDTCLCKS